MALDASPPPVPPRPHSAGSYRDEPLQRLPTEPPPVPPLPPDVRPYQDDMYRARSVEPVYAPQTQRPIRDLYANGHRALHVLHNVSYNDTVRFTPVSSPPPPPVNAPPRKIQGHSLNHVPGFGVISFQGPSPALSPPPALPPQSLPTSPAWHAGPSVDVGPVSTLMAAASLNEPSPFGSVHGAVDNSRAPIAPHVPPSSDAPRLAAPLPSVASLQNALESVQSPNAKTTSQVAWIRDVLLVVSRACAAEETFSSSSALLSMLNSFPSGPVKISDASLKQLTESAVALLISIVPSLPHRDEKLTPPVAEALFIRATLTASGAFPEAISASPRNAFREFEAAGRAGFARAWFRLGRDYESFNDVAHARQCYDGGISAEDPGCIYRIGMAKLLGQLDYPEHDAEGVQQAAKLLHQAANLATIDFPHPPYVFAHFLLEEFEKVCIPPKVLAAYVPAGSSATQEARRHLERSAFLHFAPAQQRIGRAYEFAEPPFPFDPFLSVEYYSLASAGGDAQADLALSKWYLCGAEGCFGKDEMLAREYAARAASRELPAAMFAMGYYCEVGVGAPTDIDRARQWYEKAVAVGDTEAEGRLKALADSSVPLSREQHATLAETRLVRSRTQARIRSDATATRNAVPTEQAGIRQQHGQVYQARQSSLPAHNRPSDHYGPPFQSMQRHRPLQHSASLPPPPYSGSAPAGSDFAPPQQPYLRQFPDRPRYSLVDPGVQTVGGEEPSPSFTGARRFASVGASMPPMRRQNNVLYSNQEGISSSPRGSPRADDSELPSETVPTAKPESRSGTRYTTFEEMGIQAGRAEDKECVIM